jgi:hypothetical protein
MSLNTCLQQIILRDRFIFECISPNALCNCKAYTLGAGLQSVNRYSQMLPTYCQESLISGHKSPAHYRMSGIEIHILRPCVFSWVRVLLLKTIGIISLLVSFPGLSIMTFAQIVTVSDEITMSKDANYDLLGMYKDRLLLSKETETEVTLIAYDQKLFQVMEKSLPLDAKKPFIIGVLPGKKTIDVFYTVARKELISIYVRRFDPGGGLLDSMMVKEVPWIGIIPRYKLAASEDRSKVVIHAMDRDENLQVFYLDMDQMELLADHFYSMSSLNFRATFKDILISSGGELLVILDNAQNFSRKNEPEVTIILSGPGVSEPKVEVKSFMPFNLKNSIVKLDEQNQKLIFSALYTERNTTDALGVIYCAFDLRQKKWNDNQFIPFDIESLTEIRTARRTRIEALSDVVLEDILVRQDGGIVAFVEERKEFERSLYQGRRDFYGMRFAVDYYYEDIFAVAVNPDGSSHWQKRLQKKQYSFDDDALFSSFFLFKTPSYVRIIYNDEIKNENTVSEYVVTGGGQSERRNVLNTNRQDLRLQLRNGLQLSATDLVAPSVRRNKLKLVKITFTE